jgi:Tfp pilus assembly protein PilF
MSAAAQVSEDAATDRLASLFAELVNCHHSARFTDAIALCDQILAIRPDLAAAHSNRGVALAGLGRLAEAGLAYLKAIAIEPRFGDAYNNLGNVLCDLGRWDDAEYVLREAIRLKPQCAQCHSNLGTALRALWRLDDAEAEYREALALDPDFADAYNNLGDVLCELRKLDESEAALRRAITLCPQHADAHLNLSLLRLLTGDFAGGWSEYEWRWQTLPLSATKRNFAQPLWRGTEPIAGKTIFVHSEQGFGDAIQFCRYVPLLAARGARVILEVERPLQGLMRELAGAAMVIAKGDPLPDCDLQCPLLSLPWAFGTQLESIPAETPYLVAPAPAAWSWSARLGPKLGPNPRPRIGLAWSGRPTYKNDHIRSIGLHALLPLLDTDATFVSLQKDVRSEDAALLRHRGDIAHFGDTLADFSDTAALISQLDLVISADTAVAHLAGALARPVWILLPFVPDWRWLLDRDDSPWYPTARLFRQSQSRQWHDVVAQVRQHLLAFLARSWREPAAEPH